MAGFTTRIVIEDVSPGPTALRHPDTLAYSGELLIGVDALCELLLNVNDPSPYTIAIRLEKVTRGSLVIEVSEFLRVAGETFGEAVTGDAATGLANIFGIAGGVGWTFALRDYLFRRSTRLAPFPQNASEEFDRREAEGDPELTPEVLRAARLWLFSDRQAGHVHRLAAEISNSGKALYVDTEETRWVLRPYKLFKLTERAEPPAPRPCAVACKVERVYGTFEGRAIVDVSFATHTTQIVVANPPATRLIAKGVIEPGSFLMIRLSVEFLVSNNPHPRRAVHVEAYASSSSGWTNLPPPSGRLEETA